MRKLHILFVQLCLFLPALLSTAVAQPSKPLSPAALEAFAQEWAHKAADAHNAPGVLAAAVGPDGVLATAIVNKNMPKGAPPLNFDKSLLRFGSISKIVSAAATARAIEEGLVDLDTDIRAYIDPDLVAAYSDGLTIRRLMTHTAGVGDRFFDQTVPKGNQLPLLEEYLAEELSRPTSEPGRIFRYSNQGVSLAAHAVETQARRPFASYAYATVLGPLGAETLTFIPDANDALQPGFRNLWGKYRELPIGHWKGYPASSLVGTAADLARFMAAQLRRDPALVSDSGYDLLHGHVETLDTGLEGMGLGFMRMRMNGQLIVWHSGHMPGHRTGFFLLPEHDLGWIVYNNSDIRLFDYFIVAFIKEFFPMETPAGGEPPADIADWEGKYRHNWFPEHTLGRAAALFGFKGAEIDLSISGDRVLLNGSPLIPLGGGMFHNPADGARLAFVERDGEPGWIHLDGPNAYERVSFWDSRSLHLTLIAGSFLVFFLSFAGVLLRFWKGRKRITKHTKLELSVLMVAGLQLAYVLGFFLLVANGAYALIQSPPQLLPLILVLPLAALFPLFFFVYFGFAELHASGLERWHRAFAAVFLLANAAFYWFLHHWNMLGVQY